VGRDLWAVYKSAVNSSFSLRRLYRDRQRGGLTKLKLLFKERLQSI
jgi:hypothetical protein